MMNVSLQLTLSKKRKSGPLKRKRPSKKPKLENQKDNIKMSISFIEDLKNGKGKECFNKFIALNNKDFFTGFCICAEWCVANKTFMLKPVIKHLTDKSSNFDTVNSFISIMKIASSVGNLYIVKRIFETCYSSNNAKNNIIGADLLIIASFYGHLNIINFLICNKKININNKNEKGWFALMCAANKGHLDVINRLLDCKEIDVIVRNKE